MNRVKAFFLIMTFDLFLVVATCATPQAEVFSVSTPEEFQSALTQAQSNGEDDVINVAPGTFDITSTLTYTTDDGDGSLTIQAQDPNDPPVLKGGYEITILAINTDADEDCGDGNNQTIHLKNLIFTHEDVQTLSPNNQGVHIVVGEANVTVEGCTFRKNSARDGGGLKIVSTIPTLCGEHVIALKNNSFIDNKAQGTGGLGGAGFFIGAPNAKLKIFDNQFLSNSSNNGAAGGKIYSSKEAVVRGNHFEGNSGGPGGLDVSHSKNVSVSDNEFIDNDSWGVGGLKVVVERGFQAVIENNLFQGNECIGPGGAVIYVHDNGMAFISGNTFLSNRANREGAALSIYCSGEVTVENNFFGSNRADYVKGGALSLYSQGSTTSVTAVVRNNVFYQNRAYSGSGGAIYAKLWSQAYFINNTFFENFASSKGGHVYIVMLRDDSRAGIYNNILYDDEDLANAGDELYIDADANNNGIGSVIELFNNDFGPSTTFEPVNGYIDSLDLYITDTDNYTHGGNIIGNPNLADPENADFHLNWGSMCIDAGDSSAPYLGDTDFEGDIRIIGVAVDIGADEVRSVPFHPLNISPIPENGNISSMPSGINCGDGGVDCIQNYPEGTNVTLIATPSDGYIFSGWNGDCSGCGENSQCTITMTEERTCSGEFKTWRDITEGVSYIRSRTLYDRIHRSFFVLIDVTNNSGADLEGPVRMVLVDPTLDLKTSGPGLEPDGYTEGGEPYFIIVPEDETWKQGETLEDLRLDFMLQRRRLSFDLRFEQFGP